MRFALALHTDDGGRYGVTVPDLPGCFSAGDIFDEAVEMAREAIDAHCELLAEKGLGIPAPRSLAQHQANPDLAGAVWMVIDVDVERYLGRAARLAALDRIQRLLDRPPVHLEDSRPSRDDLHER